MTYINVETNKLNSEDTTKSLFFHRLESVFNPTTSSYPGSRQHLREFDKVIVNFTLPPNRAMFAGGLWAIKITKLTAGAKRFCDPREGLP